MSSDTIHVYDTWVNGKSGRIHFDVMTTDEATALKLAKEYFSQHRRTHGDDHHEGMPILSQ
ncbi:MAG: DUF2024 family protein [Nitrospira sp.]